MKVLTKPPKRGHLRIANNFEQTRGCQLFRGLTVIHNFMLIDWLRSRIKRPIKGFSSVNWHFSGLVYSLKISILLKIIPTRWILFSSTFQISKCFWHRCLEKSGTKISFRGESKANFDRFWHIWSPGKSNKDY